MDWNFHPILVEPFDLRVMNANVAFQPAADRETFLVAFRECSAKVTDEELGEMLKSHWRPSKVAAWFIAHGKRTQFVSQLESMLIERPRHADHICIALAHLGASSTPASLMNYLSQCAAGSLQHDWYDQAISPDWAVCALEHFGVQQWRAQAVAGWHAFLDAQQGALTKANAGRVGHALVEEWRGRLPRARGAFSGAIALIAAHGEA